MEPEQLGSDILGLIYRSFPGSAFTRFRMRIRAAMLAAGPDAEARAQAVLAIEQGPGIGITDASLIRLLAREIREMK